MSSSRVIRRKVTMPFNRLSAAAAAAAQARAARQARALKARNFLATFNPSVPPPPLSPDNQTNNVNSLLTNYISYAQSFITNPAFLIPFILIAYVIFQYNNNLGSDPISNFLVSIKTTNPKLHSLLQNNLTKFVASLAFIPSILALPESKRTMFIISLTFYIFVFSNRSPYEYILDGMLASMYLKTNNTRYKYCTLAIIALIYIFGFSPDQIFSGPSAASTPAPSGTLKASVVGSGK